MSSSGGAAAEHHGDIEPDYFSRPVLPLLVYRRLSTQVVMTTVRPVVMSGPSGGGKSTILKRLFEDFPKSFAFSVSHTTRNPRDGEENGKDYIFINTKEFEQMISDGGFLEHAQFSGNRYGTSKKSVLNVQNTGRICILDVEINGVKSIKQTDLNARYIFIKLPTMEILKQRLEDRRTETEDSLKKRLDTAREALQYAEEKGSYDHIIVNDDLNIAFEKVKAIFLEDIKALQQDDIKT